MAGEGEGWQSTLGVCVRRQKRAFCKVVTSRHNKARIRDPIGRRILILLSDWLLEGVVGDEGEFAIAVVSLRNQYLADLRQRRPTML